MRPPHNVRTFRSTDTVALLELWRRAAPTDAVSYDWFYDCVLLDPNFDAAGLFVIDDRAGGLAGCAYAIRRRTPLAGTELDESTGWIPFFFVDPAARRSGIGAALVTRALGFLRALGRTRVYFGCYTPYYLVPGIEAARYPDGARLLTALGFVTVDSPVAMDRSLVGYATPDVVLDLRAQRLAEGFVISSPHRYELPEVIDLAATEFALDWGAALRDFALARRPLHQILTVRRDGRVVGFGMYGAYRRIRERFGPFGLAESVRGAGLGKILLHECLTAMVADGLHNAWFLWTGEESPAGHLYRQAGFAVTRRFDVLRRDLDHQS